MGEDRRMGFDFDAVIDRRNTWSIKWDYSIRFFGQEDILPMWVADMDFPSPPAVIEAVKKRAEHGVFGYTGMPDTCLEAVMGWMKRRNGWDMEKEWIVHSPGVVTSVITSVLTFTVPGERVLVQPPVYHPFYSSISDNGRQLVVNPLKLQDGRYTMDFEDLEAKLLEGVKMMILCSPHNPVGRVWTKEELAQLGEICTKYDVLVVSDEIHSDLIYQGYSHTPFPMASEKMISKSVLLISPTKTFNLAGLYTSFEVIPDSSLRKLFEMTLHKNGAAISNILGITAAEAAFRNGEEWLNSLMLYLRGNLETVVRFFKERIPAIKVIIPEGTYLVWLDCREMGMSEPELKDFFIKEARVGLNNGSIFGSEGTGFQRMNIACPRNMLIEGLKRIESAMGKLML